MEEKRYDKNGKPYPKRHRTCDSCGREYLSYGMICPHCEYNNSNWVKTPYSQKQIEEKEMLELDSEEELYDL